MHQIVYFGAKPLYLAAGTGSELEDYLHQPETIFIDEANVHAVRTMIRALEGEEYLRGIMLCTNTDQCLELLKNELVFIEAAGGFVINKKKEVLLIFRRGRWDLPKGKLDEGEDITQCAVREVMEETGISKVELQEKLVTTYHTYHQDGKHILKASHWYAMTGPKSRLVPQTEEDIERCEWIPAADLAAYADRSYGSIREVLKAGNDWLQRR